ncbi:MAG: flavodoxin family protein [bacterium]|nr:flavodoxin family protein [bacterium]MDD5354791.1 flavodoxin family protein [bacterium]MDD5756815.1 flavodoxin family protein [bacterium]
MSNKILVISGSPVKNGNTATLVNWFTAGARAKGAPVEIINTAFLKYKVNGCISCRRCQKIAAYECVINDAAKPILAKMNDADVIVMATPLYFYGPSAQLKLVMDRMFSLFKWDNKNDTMTTRLTGKTFVLIASAFEDVGLKDLERPFAITADYAGMKFRSLLVPNAGESGEVKKIPGIRTKTIAFGKKLG